MTDRYRKKPVDVRAWKISLDGQEPDWVREAFDGERIDWCSVGEGLYINTLEGRMKASIGDMLVEGVTGELYGCRADIFAATYEPVETPPSFPAQPTEIEALRAEVRALRKALTEMVSWFPSADTYLRLGFDPSAPMEALKEAKAVLEKENGNEA